MTIRRAAIVILCCASFLAVSSPVFAYDELQRSFAVVETLVPVALVFAQGADNLPEFAAFAGSLLLLSTPNVAMLLSEAAGLGGLTRTLRDVNFWIDAVAAVGSLGIGIAMWAGVFGTEPDIRGQGAIYVGLSLPLAFGALIDTIPFAVEPAPVVAAPSEE